MVQRPIGPVAVFGASNFPLAFSTAGGDTAAALAAGCPVVVKGHPAHPGTGEIVAQAIHAAIQRCDLHPGVFSLIQGDQVDYAQALVQHPLILAVGFTGSLGAGRALFDLCAARPEPIPFFGELGSVNPMFVLPAATAARGAEIGAGWAGSLTMGAGQFCTNPGIAVIASGPEGDALVAAAAQALQGTDAQCMLTQGIAQAYRSGKTRLDDHPAVRAVLTTTSEGRTATPNLYETDAKSYLADPTLGEEVFGPLGLVVRVETPEEMQTLARGFEGQLTATLHMDEADTEAARRLAPILERKAGRLLVNGFPTGVEVAESMVHGGPYPASTNFGATSVGTLSIRRFLRPHQTGAGEEEDILTAIIMPEQGLDPRAVIPQPKIDGAKGVEADLIALDRAKDAWAQSTVADRMSVLRALKSSLNEVAEDWVRVATGIKRIPDDTPYAGEEWMSGPYAVMSWCNAKLTTLSQIEGKAYLRDLPKRLTTLGAMWHRCLIPRGQEDARSPGKVILHPGRMGRDMVAGVLEGVDEAQGRFEPGFAGQVTGPTFVKQRAQGLPVKIPADQVPDIFA
eukprot:g20970.t1